MACYRWQHHQMNWWHHSMQGALTNFTFKLVDSQIWSLFSKKNNNKSHYLKQTMNTILQITFIRHHDLLFSDYDHLSLLFISIWVYVFIHYKRHSHSFSFFFFLKRLWPYHDVIFYKVICAFFSYFIYFLSMQCLLNFVHVIIIKNKK